MPTESIEIFITYAKVDRDERHLGEIIKDIEILKNSEARYNGIDYNHQGFVLPGQRIEQRVTDYLQEADLIILLFSRDFLHDAVKAPYKKHFNLAVQKEKEKKASVLPVIIRPCQWEMTYFRDLLPLPDKGNSVEEWENKDQAYLNINRGIRRIIDEMIDRRLSQRKRGESHLRILNPRESNDSDQVSFIIPSINWSWGLA